MTELKRFIGDGPLGTRTTRKAPPPPPATESALLAPSPSHEALQARWRGRPPQTSEGENSFASTAEGRGKKWEFLCQICDNEQKTFDTRAKMGRLQRLEHLCILGCPGHNKRQSSTINHFRDISVSTIREGLKSGLGGAKADTFDSPPSGSGRTALRLQVEQNATHG